MMNKLEINTNTTDIDELKLANEASKDAYEAVVFLSGLNSTRYQELIDKLANAYLNGRDEYPKTPVEAYKLVTN